jgi:uncharacterized Tic20 family protein
MRAAWLRVNVGGSLRLRSEVDMIKAVRIIGALIILFSFIPIGFGGYLYKETKTFLNTAIKTRAVVIEVESRRSDDGTMFYPVFSFEDTNGHEHMIYSKKGSYPPRYETGERVLIYYDPENPKDTKFDSFVSLWLGSIITGVLGTITLFLGLTIFLVGPIVVNIIIKETKKQPATHSAMQRDAKDGDASDDNTWAMACHLAALAGYVGVPMGNLVGPLIIWLIKKDEIPLVDKNGKESLNFQISMTIYSIISFFLCFVLIGFPILFLIFIANFILIIIASVKSNRGVTYHYPLTMKFIK